MNDEGLSDEVHNLIDNLYAEMKIKTVLFDLLIENLFLSMKALLVKILLKSINVEGRCFEILIFLVEILWPLKESNLEPMD